MEGIQLIRMAVRQEKLQLLQKLFVQCSSGILLGKLEQEFKDLKELDWTFGHSIINDDWVEIFITLKDYDNFMIFTDFIDSD